MNIWRHPTKPPTHRLELAPDCSLPLMNNRQTTLSHPHTPTYLSSHRGSIWECANQIHTPHSQLPHTHNTTHDHRTIMSRSCWGGGCVWKGAANDHYQLDGPNYLASRRFSFCEGLFILSITSKPENTGLSSLLASCFMSFSYLPHTVFGFSSCIWYIVCNSIC